MNFLQLRGRTEFLFCMVPGAMGGGVDMAYKRDMKGFKALRTSLWGVGGKQNRV